MGWMTKAVMVNDRSVSVFLLIWDSPKRENCG